MKIIFEDEYGNRLFDSENLSYIPTIGDSVILVDEEWKIKSRIFDPINSVIVLIVTQNIVRSGQKNTDNTNRLAEMNNAIITLGNDNKRIEKKNRALTEQITSIRKHINNQIQQERKNNESR